MGARPLLSTVPKDGSVAGVFQSLEMDRNGLNGKMQRESRRDACDTSRRSETRDTSERPARLVEGEKFIDKNCHNVTVSFNEVFDRGCSGTVREDVLFSQRIGIVG